MKRYILITVLILTAFGAGYFIGDANAVEKANEQITFMKLKHELELNSIGIGETKEENKTDNGWQEVIIFEGSSIKETETFKITENEWRIVWDTWPGEYGDMNFQIYTNKSNGELLTVDANIIGKGNDVSYKRGSGEYYLMINTAQPYKIIIEQR